MKKKKCLTQFARGRIGAIDDLLSDEIQLQSAIASFKDDPADSDYQRGYLHELKQIRTALLHRVSRVK